MLDRPASIQRCITVLTSATRCGTMPSWIDKPDPLPLPAPARQVHRSPSA
jgi:hypothetical protein